MTQSNAPSLSVALITVDTFESVRKTVAHLAAQTVASEIELVLCAPTQKELALDTTAVAGLHSVQIIETGSLSAVGPIRAQAARTATAAVVAYGEDHCYPDPGWAEALLRAHQEPHAAVGPAMRNANPETLVSWADLIQEYGPWMAPGRRGVVPLLQGHNSSYKRDVLLSYGPRLDTLMESETVLFWDLRSRGHTLFFEPDATAAHVNFSRWRVWLRVLWHLGRVFAHTRALEWPRMKRVAFALASPLIPGVRLARLMSSTRRNQVPASLMVRTLPMLMLGLIVDAVAQAAGSAFGPGSSIPKLTAMEFRRVQVNAS
jgi:hypothetical protein